MTSKITTVLAAALVLASTGFAIALIDRATYQADRDGDALMVKMRTGMD
jgi:succinate dehydrogenase/fumarate reductase flavoprotein subunit